MMDTRRPQAVLTLPARQLKLLERLYRAARKVFGVSGLLLLVGNIALLMAPFPHLHLCLFPLALILGPLLGYFAWRDRVVLAESQVPCPRCHEAVTVPDGLGGWPARFNCQQCGIMVELNAA